MEKSTEISVNRIGQRWTPEEIDQLTDLISLGKDPYEIANILGRCDKGVKSKAYSLKLKFS